MAGVSAGSLQASGRQLAPKQPARQLLCRVSRKCSVPVLAVYSHSSQHEHLQKRPHLERAALALTERPAVADFGSSLSQACSSLVQPAKRLRVAVDVDEVLGRFVHALNKFCKEEYGMDYSVSDYWIYEFAKIWHCDQDRSNYIVHEFFKSDHFNDGIPIIPGAFESLCRLATNCDLVVVTSRQHVIQDLTLEWLDRHYEGLFGEVYFGNHFALQGTSRKKSDICKTIGAQVLIDDNVGYAMECANAGINVLLYDWEGSYPWSKLPEGFSHPRIQVVHNWQDVEAAVHAIAAVATV
eukprot:gene8207-8398_t